MKFSTQNLLLIDRFFWFPHRLAEMFFSTFTRISTNQTDQVFVMKFMGWGSLVRFASLCEEHHADKSKIVLVTFSQQKEVCTLFGFSQQFIIRTNGFLNFFSDCWRLLLYIHQQRPSSIIDFERCSHAVATFRLLLAWQGKCTSLSFEPNRTIYTEKLIVHPVDEITLEKLYVLGIDRIPKIAFQANIRPVPVHLKKILVNINASDFLPARRYSIESFAEVVKLLHKQNTGLEFYFTGSQNEYEYVERAISLLRGIPVYNKAGIWKFDQLIEELSSCALFITGDSGPLHLSTYLGLPTIAIWGPTQAQHFGYEQTRNLFSMSLHLACSPCFKHPASQPAQFCKGEIHCLKNLSPLLIANQVSSLIEAGQNQRFVNFPQKWKHSTHLKSEVLVEN